MKMVKKLLSLSLALTMILSVIIIVPLSTSAQVVDSGSCGEGIKWSLDSNGVLTVTGTGDMTDYNDGSSVPWYNNRSAIKSVIVKSGVTSLSKYAFKYCTQLAKIEIPESLTYIGDFAFFGCNKIESIKIPDFVTKISDWSFAECPNLKTVTLGNSVKTIGWSAFYNCKGLKSITVPNSVTDIGDSAFYKCTSLNSAKLGSGLKSIGDGAFHYCSSLLSVVIPSDVTTIGESAFAGCTALTSVKISNSVTKIGTCAFDGCTKLSDVTLSNSITSIVYGTFGGCLSLKNIDIPKSVKSIESRAFSDSGLNEINIPEKVEKIDTNAFDYCEDVQKITVDAGNKIYEGKGNCIIEKSNKTLVQGCKNSIIPTDGSVTRVGDFAFCGMTNLERIIIPDRITKIGNCAFYDCTGLTSITLGNSLASIGDNAFVGCHKLVEIINHSSFNIEKESYDYGGIGSSALEIHKGNESKVKNISGYSFYTYNDVNYLLGYTGTDTKLVLPSNFNGNSYEIRRYAFSGNSKIQSMEIPNSVTKIGDGAFSCSWLLKSIVIPDSIEEIPNSAFEDCTSLESVTIGNGVTNIEENAFNYCSALTNINIPDSVLNIGCSAFSNCTTLKTVTTGSGLKEIGDSAFRNCPKLETVTLGSSVESIGYSAFVDCVGLKSINIPNTVTNIYENAFAGCSELSDISIPNGITSIVYGTFDGCLKLDNISIPNNIKSIEASAFRNTGLKEINIPEKVTAIDSESFDFCDKVEKISVDTNNSVYEGKNNCIIKKASKELIQGCKNSMVPIDGSVTKIGDYAFLGIKSLKSITIPDCITNIGTEAFNYCSGLETVKVGNGVTKIGDYAFACCDNLRSVEISSSVKQIGDWAFGDSQKLIEIINHSTVNISEFFDDYGLSNVLEVHNGNTSKIVDKDGYLFYTLNGVNYLIGYKGADKQLVLPENYNGNTYKIYKYAFYNNSDIVSVKLSDGVTYVSEYAFAQCKNLMGIEISKAVTSIKKYAFDGCVNLTNITVSPNNKNYSSAEGVLFNKNKQQLIYCPLGKSGNYTIPKGVTRIESKAFSGCTEITGIEIPEGVTYIGDESFECCTNFTKVTIPVSLTYVGNYAFDWHIKTVFYAGNQSDREKISINGDFGLFDANWIYLKNECSHTKKEVRNNKSATCTVTGYTGNTYCMDCGKTISKGKSINALGHKYTNKVTKATLTKNGKIVPTCSTCKATKTATTVYYPKTIKLSATSYTYDGKVKKPTVKVTGSNGKAIASSNYTVSYSSGRKSIGSYKVTVKFKGNYSGTKTLTFKIVPKNPTITVKSATKKATISYKKVSGGVKYQIQYSTKKSSGFKNVKTNTTSLKVTKSGLKSKKTYYFRVRAYKKVGKTTYYSGWVTKSVKIK